MSNNLPQELFGLEKEKINYHCIYLCVKSELASLRQATHKTKTLAEVSGSGKKPWRQKGTGRARAGTRRSPIFVGGGVVFGPTPERNYTQKVPKKQRLLAFLSVLALLKEANKVEIVDFSKILNEEEISTKKLFQFLKDKNLEKKSGKIIISSRRQNIFLSSRNLPIVRVVKPLSLTISLLQSAGFLLIDQDNISELKQLVSPFFDNSKTQNQKMAKEVVD